MGQHLRDFARVLTRVTPTLRRTVLQAAATADARLNRRRSVLTNDPRRLPGVDMRSHHGRRFRDIVEVLLAEFGNVDTARLREVASLKFTLEMTQSAVLSGDASKADDLVRISNLIARKERELRARIRPRDTTPSLADIAARHRKGGSPA